MPWYNGLTYEEVELAIREGRAPGSSVPGAVIEVPDGYTDWFVLRTGGDLLADFRQRWREDSELIALAKGMERLRIVGILRANADNWDSHFFEPQLVRGAVSRALRSIADFLEREPG